MVSKFLSLGATPEQVGEADVPFGEWLPDLPEQANTGAVEALNVIPSEGCYVPFKSLTPLATAVLPSAANNAIRLFDRSGDARLYAGTLGGVFTKQGTTMQQVLVAPSTLLEDFIWQFVQFGKYIVALHTQLAPSVGEVGGDTLFTPLGGSPPIAGCGARVGEFLVLGDLQNEPLPDEAVQPQRIRWSGYNNIEAPWTTDPATQADFNDMPSEGGRVVAITGREFGSVFQERSISRMSYVGLPTVFDIETVEVDRGAISTGSVIDLGSVVFFIAEDGFFIWNGTNSTPIGDNKVNRYFRERLDWQKRSRIVSAVNYANSCVMWAFPVSGGTGLQEVIIYSYKENRFSHSVQDIECLVNATVFGLTLDEMTGNLDTDYPISFDDPSFRDGRSALSAFDTTHTLGRFDGPNMAATIDTGASTGPSGRRVVVNSTWPIIDAATANCTMQVAQRDQLAGGPLTFSGAVAQEITGECPILADARYMRFRLNVPAGTAWQHARGVQVYRKPGGAV